MIQFTKQATRPIGLLSAIRKMPVNEVMVVRMEDYCRNTVSNAASLAGREIGGKFSVHSDWEGRKFIVTRKA